MKKSRVRAPIALTYQGGLWKTGTMEWDCPAKYLVHCGVCTELNSARMSGSVGNNKHILIAKYVGANTRFSGF